MKTESALLARIVEVNVLLTMILVWSHTADFFDVPDWVSKIGIFTMPCFFTISAFMYFRSFDFNNPWVSYKAKVVAQTKRLLMPLLLFNVIGAIFFWVAYQLNIEEGRGALMQLSDSNLLKSFYESKYNMPLWFLRELYFIVIFAPIVGYIVRVSKLSILLIVPIFFLCRGVDVHRFVYWLPNVYLGVYVAIYFDWIKQIAFSGLKAVKWGVVLVLALVYAFSDEPALVRAIAPLLVIIVMSEVHLFPERLSQRMMGYVVLIYCLHMPILRFTNLIPEAIGISNQAISLIVVALLTVVIAVAIGALLKKSPPVWRILSGSH